MSVTTPYYLTATSRAALAARSAEIRAHLKQRREVRQSPYVLSYQATASRIIRAFETPFMIGGVAL